MPRREPASSCATCFATFLRPTYKFGGLPQVDLHPIEGPVELFGARFEPLTVIHGETPILGFRFGSAAYLTDHSEVPAETLERLRGLDILFLDALRYTPHPTHSTVEQSLQDRGRGKTEAHVFYAHLPRPAARGDECRVTAGRAVGV